MVNAKGKGSASASISTPKNDTAEKPLTETTISTPLQKNLGDSAAVSETEDKLERIMEEVKNGDAAVVVPRTEEHANEEEKNGENGKEEKNAIEEKGNNEDAMEEDKAEKNTSERKKEEKGEASSKEKGRKPRRRNRKKKVAQGGSKTEATKDEDEPESSGKTKVSKKAESMGMIFMCSSKTKKDCYRYKVLGLPASKKDLVQKVYKGMRLFLYDFDLRLMYGIYKAAGPGGYNIESKAFNSAFPSQVRFTVLEDCLPLAEDKFKQVIKDNYYSKNKFDGQLNSRQVKDLCKLFTAASKGGPKSKKLGRSPRAETHTSADRGRSRRRGRDEGRRPPSGGSRRYLDRPVIYEREVYPYPMVPLPHIQTLPPPVTAPSYAYEMDPYRQDPIMEHRGVRLVEMEPARRDEPYIAYREREPPLYRDAVYSAGVPREYYAPAPEYRSAGRDDEYYAKAGLRPEYRSAGPSVYRL